MAISDRIRFVDWQIIQNQVVNTSLTGDRYVAVIGNSNWQFTLRSAPFTRNDPSDSKMPLSTDGTDVFTFTIPTPLDDSKGTVSGTVSVSSSTTDGAAPTPGSFTVKVSGGTGTLKAGDFIKFSNHSKVYMLSADVDLDGSSEDTMLVYPGLVKDVTGATVVYDNVQIKATPLNQPFEYSIGNDDLIEWEQTFREII
jgi:hypothetical protein